MATLRKLLPSSKPANYSGCPDDLCADPDCPFNNCPSSSSFLPPPPPSSTNKPFQLPPPVIAAIALIAALLILLSYFAVAAVFRILRRRTPPVRRNAPEENENENDHYQIHANNPVWLINTVGLRPPAIRAITAVKFRRGDGLVDGTDCAVCLSEFREDDALRLLPKCSHAFHVACIDTWLGSHTNCPMCRAPIVAGSSNEAELADENGGLGQEAVGARLVRSTDREILVGTSTVE